jgi:hypothetical protein
MRRKLRRAAWATIWNAITAWEFGPAEHASTAASQENRRVIGAATPAWEYGMAFARCAAATSSFPAIPINARTRPAKVAATTGWKRRKAYAGIAAPPGKFHAIAAAMPGWD